MSDNPYRPGAATPPLFLAGRSDEEKSFKKTLMGAPAIPGNFRITGLRGVGKTVLLAHLEQIALTDLGWASLRLQVEPRHNDENALIEVMAGLSTDLEEKLSRVTLVTNRTKEMIDQALSRFKVEWDEFSFSLGGSAKGTESTLKELIARTTQSAIRAGKSGLAILLDEAQVLTDDSDRSGEHPLSMLVAAINSLQERGVPVALVLCGLPTLKANLLKARTYSERMFKGAEVDRLSKPDTRDAFLKPLEETRVTASANLIEAVLDDVEGYPYFIQLWGAELWDEAQLAGLTELTTELLDQMRDAIYKRLDLDFYDTRVVSLRPAEQDLLLLTAQCDYPPLRTSDVRSLTEKKEANVNVLMGRLAEQGVVYRISKGIYEYTAPKFHEYLKRRATKGEWV